jgi:hypothetical protein
VATGAGGGVVVGGVVVGGVVAGGVVVGGTVGAVVAAATVNDALSWLFVSFDSVIRLTSSTKAFTVWFPAVAGHVALDEPPLAVKVTEAPGAKDTLLALHVYGVALPSTVKRTPMIVPAGVAAVPWFFTVAENFTAAPGATEGFATLVTTRSGIAVAADAGELATVVRAAPAMSEAASVAATPAMGLLIFFGRVLRDADVSIRVSSLGQEVVVVGPRPGDSGRLSTRLMRNAAQRVEKACLGHDMRGLRWSIRAGRRDFGPNLRDRDAGRVTG